MLKRLERETESPKSPENPNNKPWKKWAKRLLPILGAVTLFFLPEIASYIISATGTETWREDTHVAAKVALNILSVHWLMRNAFMEVFTAISPNLSPETAQSVADYTARVTAAIGGAGAWFATERILSKLSSPFTRRRGKK